MSLTASYICPVLPSQDIKRDTTWYRKYVGFDTIHSDDMYAVLKRDHLYIHLQWHADTDDDPLLGGSVIRIMVEDIHTMLSEFIAKDTVKAEKLRQNTPWGTHEFGFYDLNNNAIFFVQGI